MHIVHDMPRPTPSEQLASWRIASDDRALMLAVTYWDSADAPVVVEVEYCWPGVHGDDLPRSVEDDLCRDVERHYGEFEYARHFEREIEEAA